MLSQLQTQGEELTSTIWLKSQQWFDQIQCEGVHPCNLQAHLWIREDARVGVALCSLNGCWSGLWSDKIVNCRTNRYWWKRLTPKMIAIACLSNWKYFFSAGASDCMQKQSVCQARCPSCEIEQLQDHMVRRRRWARVPCWGHSVLRDSHMSGNFCFNVDTDVWYTV